MPQGLVSFGTDEAGHIYAVGYEGMIYQLDFSEARFDEIKPDANVAVRCGDVILTEGRMGRVGDKVAVRVVKPLRKPKTTFAMFEMADQSSKPMDAP